MTDNQKKIVADFETNYEKFQAIAREDMALKEALDQKDSAYKQAVEKVFESIENRSKYLEDLKNSENGEHQSNTREYKHLYIRQSAGEIVDKKRLEELERKISTHQSRLDAIADMERAVVPDVSIADDYERARDERSQAGSAYIAKENELSTILLEMNKSFQPLLTGMQETILIHRHYTEKTQNDYVIDKYIEKINKARNLEVQQ